MTYSISIFLVLVEDHVTADEDGVEWFPRAATALSALTFTDLLLVQHSSTRYLLLGEREREIVYPGIQSHLLVCSRQRERQRHSD